MREYLPNRELEHTSIVLRTLKEAFKTLGKVTVSVSYKEQQCQNLTLLVVVGDGLTLLGRDWFERIPGLA